MQIVVEKGSGKGSIFRLHDGINTIGRDISNRIRLLDPRISRHHCRIRKIGQSLFLTDLGTRNGTTVNDEFIIDCELKIGDHIALGATILKIVDEDCEPETAQDRPPSFSFFRVISMALAGKTRNRENARYQRESHKFLRRGRKALWKPPAGYDPPEARSKTIVSTDPD